MTVETTIQVYDTSKLTQPKCSVLYIGREKVGKTHCVCSWPNVCVICFSHNPETIFKFPNVKVIFPGKTQTNPEPTIAQKLDDWRFNILPAIKNRKMSEICGGKVETVAVDDLTQLALNYKLKLMGAGSQDIPKSVGKLDFDSWNLYLMWLQSDVNVLTEATKPDLSGGREAYNVLCTVHERDTLNDTGSVVKINPAVDGQFKDILPSMFGTVLWNDVRKVTDRQGKTTGQEYFVHAIAPDRFRRAGDGVGGGRYGTLPPTCQGTYPQLAALWGLKEEG